MIRQKAKKTVGSLIIGFLLLSGNCIQAAASDVLKGLCKYGVTTAPVIVLLAGNFLAALRTNQLLLALIECKNMPRRIVFASLGNPKLDAKSIAVPSTTPTALSSSANAGSESVVSKESAEKSLATVTAKKE